MAWMKAARLDELAENEPLGVELAGTSVALFLLNGAVHATGNICTHEFALLSDGYVEGGEIECPLHQARFDIATGRALCAPADKPIPVYATKVENGEVLVELPDTPGP
ncbi:MAG: non-heme iron oxygenase ferredoxin subunit [Acidisphaera sp.]|nr:non-heme iron oxygenase ferredoxin subunit [Acidisphaera sp.]